MRPSLWFGIGETGALELEVTYKTGNGSSRDHLPTLNPVLIGALECSRPELFKGSLNLWADEPVALPSPASLGIGAFTWHFVPIVLNGSAVGVVARRSDSGDIPFLEVFACGGLRAALKLATGDRVNIQLLPGKYLDLAA